MLPNIAASRQKNGVTGLQGLQKSETRINKGLQRNPESVTPKSQYKSGLQKAPESVTPINECETGLQKRGYAAGRMDKGFADFVTPVTRVTPNFNDLPCTYLKDDPTGNLIREFMEVDGLTLEEAKALAAVSVLPDCIQNPTNDIPASNDETHFTARLHLFVACGLSLDDAQAMAHRMRIRDSQRDERRLCLECLHLSGSVTARRCGQWRKTGMKGAPFPADLATILQRCPGFVHRLKIDR